MGARHVQAPRLLERGRIPERGPMPTVLSVSGSPSASSRTNRLLRHLDKRLIAQGHEVIPLDVRTIPAEALLGQDKIAEASDAARRALELGREIENQEHVAEAWRVLGLVASRSAAPVVLDLGAMNASPPAAWMASTLSADR